MKQIRLMALALALGVAFLAAAVAASPANVSAQAPPGWAPGVFYNNIFNLQNWNPLPKNSPVSRGPAQAFVPRPAYVSPISAAASSQASGDQSAAPPQGGETCLDANGGTVWIPDGASTADLTCPAPAPSAASSSGS